MPAEGMVHALEKIYRLLKSGGILLNIQPDDQPRPIEVHAGGQVYVAGHSQHRNDFAPYKDAISTINGGIGKLFTLERAGRFSFLDVFESVDEMEDYINENWQNSVLPNDVLEQARKLEEEIGGRTEAVVNEGVIIQRLKKVDN